VTYRSPQRWHSSALHGIWKYAVFACYEICHLNRNHSFFLAEACGLENVLAGRLHFSFLWYSCTKRHVMSGAHFCNCTYLSYFCNGAFILRRLLKETIRQYSSSWNLLSVNVFPMVTFVFSMFLVCQDNDVGYLRSSPLRHGRRSIFCSVLFCPTIRTCKLFIYAS
jgi:hypothetical protein